MKMMKKMIALMLVAIMALSFCACHRKDEVAVTIKDVEFTSAYYMCALINADMEAADAAEEKIDAIGAVTIHSSNKIKAARTAYDALSDAQKQYVENYNALTDAESKIADLYIEAPKANHKAIYEATGKYISGLGTPSVGSVGGEWMVIDLVRAGYPCPEGYYENVVEYVKAKIDSTMKKDFLQFVTQEEPKSELAKLATKVWNTFKAWWERTKKTEVETTARESVLRKLQRNKQQMEEETKTVSRKVDKKKDQYR